MEIFVRQTGNTVMVEVSGQIDLANSHKCVKCCCAKSKRIAQLAWRLISAKSHTSTARA